MRYPMDKLKRVMAMAGVILVAGIWIATFLTGVLGGSKELLTALLVLSVVVPVLMYAILLVARTVSGKSAIDVIDEAMKKDSKKD
jgi:fatty acid desaturase